MKKKYIKKYIKNINVKGKIVFNRTDFNVPMKNGKISDDKRIKSSIPTIEYLINNGAKIVCASHFGRPDGVVKPELSLKPIAIRLSELLKRDVKFIGKTTGDDIEQIKSNLKEGEILLLENLRFDPGETKNDQAFAKKLSKRIDIYVNDTFSTSHRCHSSIEKITEFVPISAAGILLKNEIDYLSLGIENLHKNYVVILGGVKVSDKIPVISNLMNKADTILIGGVLAYTFLKSIGKKVGNSRVEKEYIQVCSDILKKCEEKKVKILLPVDHVAAFRMEPNITIKMTKKGEEIPDDMIGFDIGIETIKLFSNEIKNAELIVWNGPMGVFEIDTFSAGTTEIAIAISKSSAISIIGGGESISAVKKAGVSDKISHISTGGGACLEFLAGNKLPGIEALS